MAVSRGVSENSIAARRRSSVEPTITLVLFDVMSALLRDEMRVAMLLMFFSDLDVEICTSAESSYMCSFLLSEWRCSYPFEEAHAGYYLPLCWMSCVPAEHEYTCV